MNINTKYIGLNLKNPIIIGSSGLTNSPENILKMEQAGAGAVVLKSIFEEQFHTNQERLLAQDDQYFWYPEAMEYINNYSRNFGLREYVSLIRETKKKVSIPIIASVNCVSSMEWPKFSLQLEAAGADAIELNISLPAFELSLPSYEIEKQYLEIVAEVKKYVSIPVAVKIGPYFTNLSRFVTRLNEEGADGIVLFNRFFAPDVNIDEESISTKDIFSSNEEYLHSLRWTALLSQKVNADFAASTGIHDGDSVIKQILAGASAVQLVSSIYKNGSDHILTVLKELTDWMESKKYQSLSDFKGKIAVAEQNTAAFERVQFMKKSYGKVLN